TILTQPVGGGNACPALAENRTGTQACTSQTPALPGAPVRPQAEVAGSVVTLSWSPPATGGAPTGYGIDLGTAPGRYDIKTNMNVGNVLRLQANLIRGEYYVRVKAYNSVGVGPVSSEVSFAIGMRRRPQSPVGLSGSLNRSVAVLSWTPPAGDGTGRDQAAAYVI